MSDNAIIRLKILIDDVRETDFSPFGNVYFDVKVVGSVTVESVPGDLKKAVEDKPLAPLEPPKDGWEILDIAKQEPAIAEVVAVSTRGNFKSRSWLKR